MCFLFGTLYSDCQVFSGLAIKWLLASRMSYKAPANGEKGRLCFKTFVPGTVHRLLSPGETNASHVIQKNDFRFSVSSNIWTGLLKWLKGPLIRQILGKEILNLHELAISRHILTLTSLVSRESFFDRNPWHMTMSIMPPVRRRHELPLKVKEGVPLRRLRRMTGWFKLTQQDDAMVQCNS